MPVGWTFYSGGGGLFVGVCLWGFFLIFGKKKEPEID